MNAPLSCELVLELVIYRNGVRPARGRGDDPEGKGRGRPAEEVTCSALQHPEDSLTGWPEFRAALAACWDTSDRCSGEDSGYFTNNTI